MHEQLKRAGQLALLTFASLVGPSCSQAHEPKTPSEADQRGQLTLPTRHSAAFAAEEVSRSESLGSPLIGRAGAMKYIVEYGTGRAISDGFHEFKRQGELFIGVRGALEYLVNPETGATISREGFHAFKALSGRSELLLGTLGALDYVVDKEGGVTLSKGYHEITSDRSQLYGKLGTRIEEIRLGR